MNARLQLASFLRDNQAGDYTIARKDRFPLGDAK